MSNELIARNSGTPDPVSLVPDRLTTREFLAFTMANESYGLPLSAVREILRPLPVTEVPRADANVLGIISVRGRITTVIDLRKRLNLPAQPVDKLSRFLLVDSGSEVLGLLVDQVLQVHRFNDDEIEVAAVVGGDLSEYVLGVGRPRAPKSSSREKESAISDQDDILILLDPGPLLKK